jgi:tRNA(Ile)-lysidine synthase
MAEEFPVLRPLLPFSRAQLREHLGARGRRWLEDASNADDRFRRNVIRHRVLPLLEDAEPGFTDSLLRWSAAHGAAPARASTGGELALAGIGAEPAPARGAQWRALLIRLAIEPSRERIRRLDDLLRGRPGRRLQLGRWLLRRERHAIAWEPAAPNGSREHVAIATPGSHRRGDETLALSESAPPESPRTPRGEAWLDADAIRWPLAWRLAQPGDAWRPLGSPGRQTVRKYLADRKVPARTRAVIGVVADTEGVIWIPGHAVAERVKLTPATKRALHGRLTKTVDEPRTSGP